MTKRKTDAWLRYIVTLNGGKRLALPTRFADSSLSDMLPKGPAMHFDRDDTRVQLLQAVIDGNMRKAKTALEVRAA